VQAGVLKGMGISSGTDRLGEGDRLAKFVTGKSLNPSISKELLEMINNFLIFLENWGEAHADQVESMLVSVGDGALNVLICTADPLYNVELDDLITDLDLDLVNEFPWVIAEVMQVPGSVQGGRIPYEKAILVYGDGKRT
jgi:hypothetical protein